jgi:hypothetical protein
MTWLKYWRKEKTTMLIVWLHGAASYDGGTPVTELEKLIFLA